MTETPGWAVQILADHPGMSQVVIAFDQAHGRPLMTFENLRTVAFLPPDQAATSPLLSALAAGMQRFGLFGGAGRVTRVGSLQVVPHRWLVALEWPIGVPAWATFLATQDRIQPQRLALVPPMLIPLTFLAHMADVMGPGRDPTAARWLVHLRRSQTALAWLVCGLFTTWLRGPSQAAARYCTLVPAAGRRAMPAGERDALATLARALGPAPQATMVAVERPEPAILRLLHALSADLWTDPDAPARGLPALLIQGLLPFDLWAGPDDPTAPAIPRTTTGLLRLWGAGRRPRSRADA